MDDIDKKCTTADTEGLEQRGYKIQHSLKIVLLPTENKKYKNTHNTIQKKKLTS